MKKRRPRRLLCLIGLATCVILQHEAMAQFVQQGSKLVGTGAVGQGRQGSSVALSADGNTAVIAGPADNGSAGAAWVFTRSGGVWSQQGVKLVGTGAVGSAQQGSSVALSADGATVLVGGFADNSNAGAAWVFTRSGGTWSQQGSKLVGTGAVGNAWQGWSVALSADGNTAIVGGPIDSGAVGAAWVFARSGGVWTQQGKKLVGTGAVALGSVPMEGNSVSLSADGNTALVGGPGDSGVVGAAWVFTRSGGVWTQQGTKLVGSGTEGVAELGASSSLSADGNTALLGGYADNGNAGAAWVFTRSEGVWIQQGTKLVGAGAAGVAEQGASVSLSADGSTALVGGYLDSSYVGAAWVFARRGFVWTQQGTKLVGSGASGAAQQGASVALSADGSTALVGGPMDVQQTGAAWVYTRVTGVGDQGVGIPRHFRLEQNYPNPFNPSTAIKYELPKGAEVRLSVFDMLGREVSVLVNERRDAGVHEVKFDGAGLSSGVYLYRLQAGDFISVKRLLLLR